jgi:type IV pilus assembly protein PilO
MRGSYTQTESIIRNIERLQPLLVVRDFVSEIDQTTQTLRLNSQGRLTPTGQPEARITTSFQLIGVVPVETTPTATPAAPAADGTTAPASPAASPTP